MDTEIKKEKPKSKSFGKVVITRKIQVIGGDDFMKEISYLNSIAYRMANTAVQEFTAFTFLQSVLAKQPNEIELKPYEDKIKDLAEQKEQAYKPYNDEVKNIKKENKILKKEGKETKPYPDKGDLNVFLDELSEQIKVLKKERNTLFSSYNKEISEKLYKEILDCSPQTTGYQAIKNKYADVSSYIRMAINANVYSRFSSDLKSVWTGEKNISTYKKGMAIPFSKDAVIGLGLQGFTWLKHDLEFVFGKDKQWNQSLVQGILDERFLLCDSSIKKEKKGIFVYLCIAIPKKENGLNPNITAKVDITFKCPIQITNNASTHLKEIGDAQKLYNLRRQFNRRLEALQGKLKFNQSGKGRTRILVALERFHDTEKNCAKTENHVITKHVVEYLKHIKAGNCEIVLRKPDDTTEEHTKHLLRYWGYYDIQEKIKYKCLVEGIKCTIFDLSKEEEKDASKSEES